MSLKGTQTEKNLWLAFSGESQTLCKYILYSKEAATAGQEFISSLFAEISSQEITHAAGLFQFLDKADEPIKRLKRAIEGEHYESTTLYKEYERVAKEEGFEEIAEYFRQLRIKESDHEQRFRSALLKLLEEAEEA